MVDAVERQRWRDEFLVALYQEVNGHLAETSTPREIGERAGIPLDERVHVAVALAGSDLVTMTMGGLEAMVMLTSGGIRQAERLQTSGAAPLSGDVFIQNLEVVIGELRVVVDADDTLTPEIRSDVLADLESANMQLRANEPNREVVRSALRRAISRLPKILSSTLTNLAALKALTGLP